MTGLSVVLVLVAVALASAAFAADKPDKPDKPAARKPATSQKAASGPSLADRAQTLAGEILKSPKVQVGISAVELGSGKKLLAINDGLMLAPASNEKVVTSAVALASLGGSYEFATRVYRCGKDGKDLAIVGDCDPTLGDPYLARENDKSIYAELDAWASAVKEKVGAKIAGDVIVYAPPDESGYRHKDWPPGQAENWYVAPVTTLNFHNNCLDVTFQKSGDKLQPAVTPYSRFIKVQNNLKPGPEHAWSLRTSEHDSVATISGTLSQASDSPVSVAIDNPPLMLGRVFVERLIQAGVTVEGDLLLVDVKTFDADKAKEICRTQTPLSTVMTRANKRSLNMAAEGMFLRACGDWDNGPALAQQVLAKSYGLSEGIKIADGCGLSKNNRVSPSAMTSLLAGILKRDDGGVFVESLPIAGADGTMERRLTEPAYKGRVLAKTGWIAGVSTLSGYILSADKKPAIAFSVLCNGVSGPADAKRLEDSICRMLVDSLK